MKKQWGGSRVGAGRNPLEETKKKKGVTIYIKSSTIEEIKKFGIGDSFSKKSEELIKTQIKNRKEVLK